ncbi:Sel1 repeat-containing protein [Variovorax sp. YR634]|jgi:hypothetical protein|uniref:tetratricopeptide repeat protein n=1 Tax=Variovorax sp. YR634 TaxID=1884385 RepID=UPI0008971796|nr:tetratricopeptide repeat protein [Variovorax sp. YR634]SDY71322.1 Sel1 repeat-containing protein [Variovorax sp. YR634]
MLNPFRYANLKRCLLAFAFGWMFSQYALAQSLSPDIATQYHQIMGNAGIARSQFMNAMTAPSTAQKEAWYERAVEKGKEEAIGNLAMLLYCGDERPKDTQRAFELLRQLSERGSAPAPWLIGIAYYFGDGVPQSYEKSLPWLELSARRANPHAVKLVAEMYDQGLGIPKSESKNTWWLEFAAAHGHQGAQLQLAERLFRKAATENDFIAAYYWFLGAKSQGANVDAATVALIESKIDSRKLSVIKEADAKFGPFRWSRWDDESVIGAYTFPCVRHLQNPVLAQMHFAAR